MRAAGVRAVFDLASHAAMLGGVVRLIGRGRAALRAAESAWRRQRPDLVILMDSTALHLPMARRAKRLGLRVLYYIAPQTWASRRGRNRRLAQDVDRVACILPFEEAFLRQDGVQATFVGHPLMEALRSELPAPEIMDQLRTSAGRRRAPLLALLPGSRRQVIDRVLPLQLAVLERLHRLGLPAQAAISAIDEDRAARIRAIVAATTRSSSGSAPAPGPEPLVLVAENAALLSAADLVLVASGTAALEVAYYAKPMIVLYDAGLLGALYGLVGDWVVTTPHLSLVNILGGARIVPEFMPRVPAVETVAAVARQMLEDEGWRRLMQAQLRQVIEPLRASEASTRVCGMIREMLA